MVKANMNLFKSDPNCTNFNLSLYVGSKACLYLTILVSLIDLIVKNRCKLKYLKYSL